MKVLILNGPNLNMLGKREQHIYGSGSYSDLVEELKSLAIELGVELDVFQSNHEGHLIDKVQSSVGLIDALIINPGGLTHTSIALRDAVLCLGDIIKVEIHLSDIDKREDFRRQSFFSDIVTQVVKGEGRDGYKKSLKYVAASKK